MYGGIIVDDGKEVGEYTTPCLYTFNIIFSNVRIFITS